MTRTMRDTQGVTPARAETSSVDLLGSNSEIARMLADYYGRLVSSDVPDRFTNLLNQLEEAEQGNKAEATGTKAEG